MIKVEVEHTSFELPQGWTEVTYKQWNLIRHSDDSIEKIISALSNVSVQQISEWGDSFILQVVPLLSWMSVQVNVDEWKIPDMFMGAKVPLDIKRYSFGQKIFLHQLMADEAKDLNNCMDKCIAIYMQPLVYSVDFDFDRAMEFSELVSDQKFCEVYPVATFLFEQMQRIIDNEVKMLSQKPEPEQLRAGINMFDQFGIINTVDALAGGDILKYEQVYKMDYNTVFTKLYRNKLEGIYHKNYRKVLERKK